MDLEDQNVQKQFEELRAEVIGQEHRFFRVFENAWYAIRSHDGWTSPMKRAAGLALAYWFLSPRSLFLVTLSIGGVIGIALAWQANYLLREQNRKMDFESHLGIAEIYANYAQRNAQLLQASQAIFSKMSPDARSKRLDPHVRAQVLSLLDALEPLPESSIVLVRDLPSRVTDESDGGERSSSLLSRLEYLVGQPGKSNLQKSLESMPVPVFSSKFLSPERGQIAYTLLGLGVGDFFRMNFNNAVLIDAGFSGADLMEAKMRNAILHGSYFERAKLYRADFRGANLANTKFKDAILANANLSNSNLTHANMSDVELNGASLSGATIYRTNFSNARMRGSSFIQTTLTHVDFRGTNLSDTSFYKSELDDVDFEGANLSRANFFGADMRRVRISREEILKACGQPKSYPAELGILQLKKCRE